jgi:hypothetical protein
VSVKGGDFVHLLDSATGKEIHKLILPDVRFGIGMGYGLAYAPDGSFVVNSWCMKGVVVAWSAITGKELWRLSWEPKPTDGRQNRRHESARRPPLRDALSLAIAPDGKTIAVACADDYVRLFEVARGGLRCKMKGATMKVVFWPNGKWLATFGYPGGNICFWDWHQMEGGPPRRLSTPELERLWRDLGPTDAAIAFQAVTTLAGARRDAEALLGNRLRHLPTIPGRSLRQLVIDLDDDSFAVRQRAAKELERLGGDAEAELRAALARSTSLQVRRTLERLLRRASGVSQAYLRALRGVEVLEYIGSATARRTLEELGSETRHGVAMRLAQEAIKRLDGKKKR